MNQIDFKALRAPFSPDYVQWRVGNVSKDGSKCTLLAYIDARAVMDRLDEVVGPENWSDRYTDLKDSGVACTLSVKVNGEWVSKEDAAEESDIEAVKGGRSDAFKRAAVKWGIGRYLYDLDADWHPIKDGYAPRGTAAVNIPGNAKNRQGPGWVERPRLPSFALPEGKAAPAKAAPAAPPPATPPAPAPQNSVEQDATWATDKGAFFSALSKVDVGLTYEMLCAWLMREGGLGKRPSQMTDAQRRALIQRLEKSWADVVDWCYEHTDAVAAEKARAAARTEARGSK